MVNLLNKIENNLELENTNESKDTVSNINTSDNINKEETFDKDLINQNNLSDEPMNHDNYFPKESTNLNDTQENSEISKNSESINCLALTIKKDYSLTVVKNVVIKALKTTWKVVVSLFTLNFIKIFL